MDLLPKIQGLDGKARTVGSAERRSFGGCLGVYMKSQELATTTSGQDSLCENIYHTFTQGMGNLPCFPPRLGEANAQ